MSVLNMESDNFNDVTHSHYLVDNTNALSGGVIYQTIGEDGVKGEFDTQKEALDLANKLNTEQDIYYYDWCVITSSKI